MEKRRLPSGVKILAGCSKRVSSSPIRQCGSRGTKSSRVLSPARAALSPSTCGNKPRQSSARLLVVQRFAEDLAGFKGQHSAGGYLYLRAGLGISAPARFLLLDEKIAETGNLDLFAPGKAVFDNIEDGFDNFC